MKTQAGKSKPHTENAATLAIIDRFVQEGLYGQAGKSQDSLGEREHHMHLLTDGQSDALGI